MAIKWNKTAARQLIDAINFIEETGYSDYAVRLEKEILQKIRELLINLEMYSVDGYRKNNSGNYRAFVVDNYRISYRIGKNDISIVRIRHTSRRVKRY
jgi:plasmid stabilization system protein ParE